MSARLCVRTVSIATVFHHQFGWLFADLTVSRLVDNVQPWNNFAFFSFFGYYGAPENILLGRCFKVASLPLTALQWQSIFIWSDHWHTALNHAFVHTQCSHVYHVLRFWCFVQAVVGAVNGHSWSISTCKSNLAYGQAEPSIPKTSSTRSTRDLPTSILDVSVVAVLCCNFGCRGKFDGTRRICVSIPMSKHVCIAGIMVASSKTPRLSLMVHDCKSIDRLKTCAKLIATITTSAFVTYDNWWSFTCSPLITPVY